MKKRNYYLALLGMTALLFAGCGENAADAQKYTGTETSGKTTGSEKVGSENGV